MNLAALLNTTAYQPRKVKADSLRVGSGLLAITSSSIKAAPRKKSISLEDSAAISKEAHALYESMRTSDGVSFTHGNKEVRIAGVTKPGGLNTVRISEAGRDDIVLTFTGDARLSFDEQGNVSLVSGKEALTGGALKASKDGEYLLRGTAGKVDGGEFSSTIVNLSKESGTFTGGAGHTRFLGAYEKSSIIGGAGGSDFAGVFTDSVITGGGAQNTYSGAFGHAEINGGALKDLFAGTFLNQSVINGNDGDDSFEGTFFDSALDGGKGNDTYGKIALADAKKRGRKWDGYVADVNFWDSAIADSEGDDVFEGVATGSAIDLGEGDDILTGAFIDSTVSGGGGDNSIRAMYAEGGAFLGGPGKDAVTLATALHNSVDAGEGENSISLGVKGADAWSLKDENGVAVNLQNSRWGKNLETGRDYETEAFGFVQGALVDASKGETSFEITVDNVTSVVQRKKKDAAEEAEEEEKTQAGATEEEQLEKTLREGAARQANSRLDGKAELDGEHVRPYTGAAMAGLRRDASPGKTGAADAGTALESLMGRVAALAYLSVQVDQDSINTAATVSFGNGGSAEFAVGSRRAEEYKWAGQERMSQSAVHRAFRAYAS